MNNVLFNENGQLRSGWRIVVFLFAFFVFAGTFRTVEEIIVAGLDIEANTANAIFFAINGAGLLFLALVIGWAAGRLFEDLPYAAVGASFSGSWLKHLAVGITLGIATMCVAVLIAFLGGGLRFDVNTEDGIEPILLSLVISLIVLAFGAAWEEAFFRGYIFQTLVRSDLAWLAIALTSAFFGIVHYGNPEATLISTINTTLAGLWFGLAYLRTRDLWLVFGLHFAWNWMQGAVFGIEISGLKDLAWTPLFKEIDTGPTWLTGTTYGIEGGVACTFALILSIAGILFFNAKTQSREDAKEEH